MAGRTRAAGIHGVSRIALITGLHIDVPRTREKNLFSHAIFFS
jgi:hypothetical protein